MRVFIAIGRVRFVEEYDYDTGETFKNSVVETDVKLVDDFNPMHIYGSWDCIGQFENTPEGRQKAEYACEKWEEMENGE